jgi:opacity protein-like surface antigen
VNDGALGAAQLAQAAITMSIFMAGRDTGRCDHARSHGEPFSGRLINLGMVVGASAGYSWDMGLAAEAEFAYRRNGLDEDVFSGVSTDVHGTLSSYTLMANGYYRFHNDTPFTPYIGGGVDFRSRSR